MKLWLKRLFLALTAGSVIAAPGASFANTRAGGGGNYYTAVSIAQAGTFPQSSWLIQEQAARSALVPWMMGGTPLFGTFATVFSNNQDSSSPSNQSNGAN